MIAILVLTYNNLTANEKFIDTLYQNTKEPFDLFIVDNGSTDGSVKFLTSLKYDNLYLYTNVENNGIIKGRNQLFDICKKHKKYEYVIFLDNDQLVRDGWDKEYLELMKRYDIIGSEAWKMRKDFFPTKRIKNKNESFNYVGCGGMMINTKVIEEIGLFHEEYSPKYFEDPDFVFHAYLENFEVGFCDKKVIDHQKHDLTLRGEEKKIFLKNWKTFYHKWNTVCLPVFKME